jgi:hypothetical protein
MLFPSQRPSVKSIPAEIASTQPRVADAATDAHAVDNPLSHTDYDLHPLTVRNFDHYIEPDHNNERFHVR